MADEKDIARKIVRAWKDPEYRDSLSPEEQAELPEVPAGFLDLSEEEQMEAVGGTTIIVLCSGIPSACERSSICGTCSAFTAGCC